MTSNRDYSLFHTGSESYAPSGNMFLNTDNKILMEKDALPGEIHEGETAEVLKETSARRSITTTSVTLPPTHDRTGTGKL